MKQAENIANCKYVQGFTKIDHTILNWPVFLWIAISLKLEIFSEIWFQITNLKCTGIRLPKFWFKISIHFGKIAIYKSGQLMSINYKQKTVSKISADLKKLKYISKLGRVRKLFKIRLKLKFDRFTMEKMSNFNFNRILMSFRTP